MMGLKVSGERLSSISDSVTEFALDGLRKTAVTLKPYKLFCSPYSNPGPPGLGPISGIGTR
jgi:hypothetical protein